MEWKRGSSPSSSDIAGDDPRLSRLSPSPQQLSSSNTNDIIATPYPNYRSSAVQEALEQLASIDLIYLCHEAKVEHCRATRDLSSCGRYVQHVLNSCGHASLCAECSQRCEVCPICRVSVPKSGSRLQLRLYNKCIEAGLISKRHDDRFQEKERYGEHLMADVLRLYSLFDVALENNLVSLVCHYITDVCLDESAVSSDPVLAFLLDEVVVKDWCKRKSKNVIAELCGIYGLGLGEMEQKLGLLLKLSLQLNDICNVIEVLESSFTESLSTQLYDLHLLSENMAKSKQHLEVMTWCIRHHFLKNVQSRYPDDPDISWNLHVSERKSAAVKRMWPDITSTLTESAVQSGSTLFIEDALSNLRIQQGYGEVKGESDVSCLQEDGYGNSDFLSKIDGVSGLYPFRNLRAAADILFLFGTSDMVVAKQAIFLYYLFDRHWTMPDNEWRHVIDDFATSFGINRRMLLESLVFYLLDDHSDEALQEASHLLPEIAVPETHPKIAQVLLERQKPDLALMVLRCSGRDGFSAYTNIECEGVHMTSLSEAVTAVRVRVECGLLTEAFMYARMYCLKVKEHKSKHSSSTTFSDGLKGGGDSWVYHIEVLVTEICSLCIRRNLVDRMIELPWNSDEEKYLHKCLFDNASQKPSSTSGSLLVVFYLQRCRYIEAYQADRKLQNFEQKISETASEEEVSRIRSMSQWRAGLVDKCIDLLPEVQRLQIKNEILVEIDLFSSKDIETPSDAGFSRGEPQNPTSILPSMKSSLVLQTDLTSFLSTKTSGDMHSWLSSPVSTSGLEFYDTRAPSVLHRRILPSHGSPSIKVDYPFSNGKYSSNPQNGSTSASSSFITRDIMRRSGVRQGFQSGDFSTRTYPVDLQSTTPLEESNMSLSKLSQHGAQFQVDGDSFRVVPYDSMEHVENNGHSSFMHRASVEEQNVRISTPHFNGFSKTSSHDPISISSKKKAQLERSRPPIVLDEARMDSSWSFGKGDFPVEDFNMKGGPRWRSDESSEEEAKAERTDVRTLSAKRRGQYRRR